MPLPFEQYRSSDYLVRNPSWDQADSPWKAVRIEAILREHDIKPRLLAEVGCGAGGVLAALRPSHPETELYGYDIAPAAARFWDNHSPAGIHFTVGDFFVVSNRHYEVILLIDVIEHLANPFDFLVRLRERADYVVLHFPLDLSAISVARESPLLHTRNKTGHIHYFTKGLALALLRECGYQVLEWQYTGAAFSAPQRTWKTRLAGLARRIAYGVHKDTGVRLLGGETLLVLARPEDVP